MKISNPLTVLSHRINFTILIYILINTVNTFCFKTLDLIISFIGLFISLFVNIVSVLDSISETTNKIR